MNGAHEGLNPAWIAVAISGATMLGSFLLTIIGIRVGIALALQKLEMRIDNQGQHLGRVQSQVDHHSGALAHHSTQLALLNNAVDIRPPPADYSPG